MFFVVHINVFVFPFQWNEVTEQWDKVSLSFSVASYMYLYFCYLSCMQHKLRLIERFIHKCCSERLNDVCVTCTV